MSVTRCETLAVSGDRSVRRLSVPGMDLESFIVWCRRCRFMCSVSADGARRWMAQHECRVVVE